MRDMQVCLGKASGEQRRELLVERAHLVFG
jgi:hypothetical protein